MLARSSYHASMSVRPTTRNRARGDGVVPEVPATPSHSLNDNCIQPQDAFANVNGPPASVGLSGRITSASETDRNRSRLSLPLPVGPRRIGRAHPHRIGNHKIASARSRCRYGLRDGSWPCPGNPVPAPITSSASSSNADTIVPSSTYPRPGTGCEWPPPSAPAGYVMRKSRVSQPGMPATAAVCNSSPRNLKAHKAILVLHVPLHESKASKAPA